MRLNRKAPLSNEAKRAVNAARAKAQHEEFLLNLAHEGVAFPTLEYRFHPTRKWRFDYAWVSEKVALEIDGGGAIGGRHSRIDGMRKDAEKANAAIEEGWRVLRALPEARKHTELARLVARIIKGRT
jgi:very-short-patch-repair endonuclease